MGEIQKNCRPLFSVEIAFHISNCSVCKIIRLILIANTGSTGAKISQIMLLPAFLESILAHHKTPGSLMLHPHPHFPSHQNTMPRGTNAIIARRSTTLIISVAASATSGINTATLIADLSKNSVKPPIEF